MRKHKVTISVTVTTENYINSDEVADLLDEYINEGFSIGAVGVFGVKDTEVLGAKEVGL